ncbi:hypothetical protein FOA52_005445 [Chlamydomonas sp. UWO 241]|nr:hypothetical protein FOA52_005445 [Chlamydomonas sp. UWO 241]
MPLRCHSAVAVAVALLGIVVSAQPVYPGSGPIPYSAVAYPPAYPSVPASSIPADMKPENATKPDLETRMVECTDVVPNATYTCAEQLEFGKCEREWMVEGHYCDETCGRLPCPPVAYLVPVAPPSAINSNLPPAYPPAYPPTPAPEPAPTPAPAETEGPDLETRKVECTDVAPNSTFTCAEQLEFGKCAADWMFEGHYCDETCGREPCCGDLTPPGSKYTCEQQAKFPGKCEAEWMVKKGYCRKACGAC